MLSLETADFNMVNYEGEYKIILQLVGVLSLGKTAKALTDRAIATPIIDVRMLALRAFRDKIVYPIAGRLESRLAVLSRRESVTTFGSGGVVGLGGEGGYQPPRLQQM